MLDSWAAVRAFVSYPGGCGISSNACSIALARRAGSPS
ncbi:Uncharacterised protein [Mycobacterium tuberculosis]|uniref:Uncharacterized protein n=1 Tax=Mycobacterium tuberculosis TaxID=1773 RepID=A0A654TYK4_MYCTX|nr:Uncharacterised protein [Mycobacterium tuberculosis]CKO29093.1 Uncharacterised protein [Mycobacterium tuberculosis]